MSEFFSGVAGAVITLVIGGIAASLATVVSGLKTASRRAEQSEYHEIRKLRGQTDSVVEERELVQRL